MTRLSQQSLLSFDKLSLADEGKVSCLGQIIHIKVASKLNNTSLADLVTHQAERHNQSLL